MVDAPLLRFLLHTQSGVLSRRQFLDTGHTDNDIDRLVRRREWRRVVPGVLVNHTGPLDWQQRAWVAVLACEPAALTRESAVPGLRSAVIHVAIPLRRQLLPPPGVRLHPTADFAGRVDASACPPRLRVEHALIDLMSQRIVDGDVAGAYAALAEACHRATSPDRITRTLAGRRRVAGRSLIAGMVDDLRTGACSVLEREYLRLERAHRLPRGVRQRASDVSGRRGLQDVRYEEYGVVVELNGRSIHDNPVSWDNDARRDLAELAISAAVTARLTYGLVFREGCRTIRSIGQVLERNGWDGPTVACPRCPPDGQGCAASAPGADAAHP